mmetsp:Transcript_34119/g.55705  ORF Transcript_34119/g.55705 Transcript_34119/m.55705 type:complete len:403 (+) Transcript_34119:100-1308(+)
MSSLRLAIKRSLKDMPAAPRIGNSDSDKPQRRQKSSLVDSINASSNCKTDTLMEKCSAITESRKNEGPNSSDNDAIDNNNDSDDEELGALIYKWSRTAKLKAEASSSKTAQMSSSSTESISSQQTPRQQDGKLNMSMKRKHHPSITESDANITICARHTDHLQCAHFGVHVDGRDIVEDSVEESNNVNVGDVGYTFRKQFGDDWYTGKVVGIRPGPRTRAAGQKEDRRCLYEDGDAEDLSLPELQELALLDPEKKSVSKPYTVRQHSQRKYGGHESKFAKCNHKVCVKLTTCRVKPKSKCCHEGCTNRVCKGGVCWTHGAKKKKCWHEGCTTYARDGGVCTRHGAKKYRKVCKHDGCTSFSQVDGACYKHGTNGHCRKTCSREGCNNLAQKGGVCRRHGANI